MYTDKKTNAFHFNGSDDIVNRDWSYWQCISECGGVHTALKQTEIGQYVSQKALQRKLLLAGNFIIMFTPRT